MILTVQPDASELREQNPVKTLTTTVVEPNGSSWEGLLNCFPDAGPFHTGGWAQVLKESYGYRPSYMKITQGEQVHALIPVMESRRLLRGQRGIALPFTDLCAPLTSPEFDPADCRDALESLVQNRGWKSLEVRGHQSGSKQPSSFFRHELRVDQSIEGLWNGLAQPLRRAIRRARKGGVQVRFTKDAGAFGQFVRLHDRTRRMHGAPLQPRVFLKQIHRRMILEGSGLLAIAELNDEMIAAAVFLRHGSRVVYKFGASDRAHLAVRPNNLLMWQAIEHFAADGVSRLCFGRSSVDQAGLRQFKCSFGADEVPLYYSQFQPGSGWQGLEGESTGLLTPFFRVLPLPLGRLVGPLAYKLHS